MDALAELEAELPSGTLLDPSLGVEAYSRDETEALHYEPQVVARPIATADVSAILAWASRHRVPVTPQGARTGLSGGALPVFGGVALSLERLDRIRRLDLADQIVEVEAGVVTGQLQARVREEGLYYPPDPASRDTCQIGGNIAEDAAGPHSCKYGTTRRYVLGLEAVLPDGSVIRTGGANRKDVSGYSLTQLLVGSEGTLAVVTAATLRLIGYPAARLTLGLAFESLERGAQAVLEVFESGVEPAACELLEARALELVHASSPLPEALRDARSFVLLELDGPSRELLLDSALRLARRFEPIVPLVAADERDRQRLWEIRSKIGSAVKHYSTYKEIDAVVPRSSLAALVRAARRAADAAGLECVCYGHAGDGNLHVNLLRGRLEEDEWNDRRDRAEDELIEEVLRLGGAVAGEHGIGWTQRRHLRRAFSPAALDLMVRLKKAFDPLGILNPGKVLP